MHGTGKICLKLLEQQVQKETRCDQREPRASSRANQRLRVESLDMSKEKLKVKRIPQKAGLNDANSLPTFQPILPTIWPEQSVTSYSKLLAPFPSISPPVHSDAMSNCPMQSRGIVDVCELNGMSVFEWMSVFESMSPPGFPPSAAATETTRSSYSAVTGDRWGGGQT